MDDRGCRDAGVDVLCADKTGTLTQNMLALGEPFVVNNVPVVGTQIVATLIAVYGLFMTPLGWGWALSVWAYALVWFLFNDRLKLLACRILDPVKTQQ